MYQAADVAVGTCVLTQDRTLIASGTDWFKMIGSFISTSSLKPLKQPFLVLKVFTWHVSIYELLVLIMLQLSSLFHK